MRIHPSGVEAGSYEVWSLPRSINDIHVKRGYIDTRSVIPHASWVALKTLCLHIYCLHAHVRGRRIDEAQRMSCVVLSKFQRKDEMRKRPEEHAT